MTHSIAVGLDITKNVFHAHGIDEDGDVIVSRKLRRAKVTAFFASPDACLTGIEACGSSHHWARVFAQMGHEVKPIPPRYVKPYVKSQKNEAADAEAICEGITRPTMRFVEVKSIERQSVLVLHRTRAMAIRHRTRVGNGIRAHLGEFGIVAPIGRNGLDRLIAIMEDHDDVTIGDITRHCLAHSAGRYRLLQERILDLDRQIRKSHRASGMSGRLATIRLLDHWQLSALDATIGNACAFKSGRSLSACSGQVPEQSSSGGKEEPGKISKRGDACLRRLLVAGAMAVVRYAQRNGTRRPWRVQSLARRPGKTAIFALANKMAWLARAVMVSTESYRDQKHGHHELSGKTRRKGRKGQLSNHAQAVDNRGSVKSIYPWRLERVLSTGS